MNLLLFILALLISFVIVRIGATAFEITGMENKMATFQAVSCFTSTGFTTTESEMITIYPLRRKIATFLMILGYAGLATFITTFINSLNPHTGLLNLDMPVINLIFHPNVLPIINLIIIILSVYFAFKLFSNTKFAKKLSSIITRQLVIRQKLSDLSFEELNSLSDGYGVASITIFSNSTLIGLNPQSEKFKNLDISVLAVDTSKNIIPKPNSDFSLKAGYKIICFGQLESMRNLSLIRT